MYIHSYQIHNVLNVYRKQLSQETSGKNGEPTSTGPTGDTVALSSTFKRQSLIDQVSAEIVDRMTQGGTLNRFDATISREWRRAMGTATAHSRKREAAFTFSAIDENNQKTTNSLPVERFSPLTGRGEPRAQESDD